MKNDMIRKNRIAIDGIIFARAKQTKYTNTKSADV